MRISGLLVASNSQRDVAIFIDGLAFGILVSDGYVVTSRNVEFIHIDLFITSVNVTP